MNADKGKVSRCASGWLDLSDQQLIDQCAVDLYRASGPGGQKRNKTSSAVRLRHEPTGLIVTATESRSQHENRARALRRLREAIAMNRRNHLDPESPPPAAWTDALRCDRSLHVNRKHEDYWHIVQYVLDVFAASEARVSDAARRLGIPTGHLNRFLKNDPKLWEHANRIRQSFGHPLLR